MQRQEDLPAREPARQPVRRVHRERRLAHPGHPADRMDPHRPARLRSAGHRDHQLGQLPLPPGERGDVPRQRPRRRRHPARADPAPGRRLEPGPHLADQAQRIGQQPHRLLLRTDHRPPLQVGHRPYAQPRRLRQLLLRQPRLPAQLTQQAAEPGRRLSHSPTSRRSRLPAAFSPHPRQRRHHPAGTAGPGNLLGTVQQLNCAAAPGPWGRCWASPATSATRAARFGRSTKGGRCTESALTTPQAEGCHRQTPDLARTIGSPWDEVRTSAGLGRCALAVGQASQALASCGRPWRSSSASGLSRPARSPAN